MSDSEGSIVSLHGSEKSTCDETVDAMPTQQNHNGDKSEEFEKLLQSMTVPRNISDDEEQMEKNDNTNEKKIVGTPLYINCCNK
jgi:hypothetical protein